MSVPRCAPLSYRHERPSSGGPRGGDRRCAYSPPVVPRLIAPLAVEKPDPYTCPDDFPEAIKQLLTVLKRGQNCATADPQDGDLESLLSHVADDVELIVPKTFIEKSIKDGGDPINRAGKEEVAKILKYTLGALSGRCGSLCGAGACFGASWPQ